MSKAELIERIIDRITDPWTESCEDYVYAELIDLDDAKDIIAQCREEDMDLEPEDRLPDEVTPELMMIAFNCNVRKNKHELQAKRLAEYITDNEMVCEYDNYYLPTLTDGIDLIPVDFLANTTKFPFEKKDGKTPDIIDLFRIFSKSRHTFRQDDEFCWYDKESEILHSTDRPFRDGVLNAEDFAEYMLSDEGQDCLDYIVENMDNDSFKYIFGHEKEESIHE